MKIEDVRKFVKDVVDSKHIITWKDLHHLTSEAYSFEFKDQIFSQALSELIQAGELRRYEYRTSSHAGRLEFYMPADFRLMF